MTMSEVEFDRITQQVFAARNSGGDAALVKVVIDEIEKATEAQAAKIARVEALADEWFTEAHPLYPHGAALRLRAALGAEAAESEVAKLKRVIGTLSQMVERRDGRLTELEGTVRRVEALAKRLAQNDEMAQVARDYLTWASEQIHAALRGES